MICNDVNSLSGLTRWAVEAARLVGVEHEVVNATSVVSKGILPAPALRVALECAEGAAQQVEL